MTFSPAICMWFQSCVRNAEQLILACNARSAMLLTAIHQYGDQDGYETRNGYTYELNCHTVCSVLWRSHLAIRSTSQNKWNQSCKRNPFRKPVHWVRSLPDAVTKPAITPENTIFKRSSRLAPYQSKGDSLQVRRGGSSGNPGWKILFYLDPAFVIVHIFLVHTFILRIVWCLRVRFQ